MPAIMEFLKVDNENLALYMASFRALGSQPKAAYLEIRAIVSMCSYGLGLNISQCLILVIIKKKRIWQNRRLLHLVHYLAATSHDTA